MCCNTNGFRADWRKEFLRQLSIDVFQILICVELCISKNSTPRHHRYAASSKAALSSHTCDQSTLTSLKGITCTRLRLNHLCTTPTAAKQAA
eukprot:1238052-Amphidinium_carterae.1